MSGSKIRMYIVNGLGQRKELDQIIREDTLEEKESRNAECNSVEEKNQELLKGISQELLWEIYEHMSVLEETLFKVMKDTKIIHEILENSLWETHGPRSLRGAYNAVFQDKPELRRSCLELHSSISTLRDSARRTIKHIEIASEKSGEENGHE